MRCEHWELDLLDHEAVSDNTCQEEITGGAADTDRGRNGGGGWGLILTGIYAEPSIPNLNTDMNSFLYKEWQEIVHCWRNYVSPAWQNVTRLPI